MKEQYIAKMARKYGLDPAAVLAIASHEGLSGGVGDGGHAFGPFQMNDAGGVLTNAPASHHSNAWAWSPAGIRFALSHMATVAKGLKGKEAIHALVYGYERPADKPGEERDAISKLPTYRSFRQPGGSVAPGTGTLPEQPGVVPVGTGTKVQTHFDQATFQKQAGLLLMQHAQGLQTGIGATIDPATGQPSTAGLLDSLKAARQAAMVRTTVNVGQQGGQQPGQTPGGPTGGGGGGGGAGGSVVAAAARQIGQPYVWGGESRKEGGFDCSGLIQWAYGARGIHLPRTAAEMGRTGRSIKMNQLKKGDLLVARDGSHVVMYAGGGRVIAAPHTGTNVQYENASYFMGSDYQARRVL